MSFIETVRRARDLLREEGRISLRGLKREFDLDDEPAEALRAGDPARDGRTPRHGVRRQGRPSVLDGGRRKASVHLFDLSRHRVYVRAGLRIALVAAGGMALGAVAHSDWGGAEFPLYFLIFSGVVWAPLCVAMTLLPVWGIHRAIQVEKQRERDRVLAAIAGDSAALEASPLAAHASALTGVTLLDYLEKVDRVREWSFDASPLRRLGLYLLVPPLGWLGGALVERTLERVLQ